MGFFSYLSRLEKKKKNKEKYKEDCETRFYCLFNANIILHRLK